MADGNNSLNALLKDCKVIPPTQLTQPAPALVGLRTRIWRRLLTPIRIFCTIVVNQRRRRFKPRRLSPYIEDMAFTDHCVKVLHIFGWKVVDSPWATQLVIEKPGRPLYVLFRPPQERRVASALYDWAEQNNMRGIPLVVITYYDPQPELVRYANQAGITLLSYLDIPKFDDLFGDKEKYEYAIDRRLRASRVSSGLNRVQTTL